MSEALALQFPDSMPLEQRQALALSAGDVFNSLLGLPNALAALAAVKSLAEALAGLASAGNDAQATAARLAAIASALKAIAAVTPNQGDDVLAGKLGSLLNDPDVQAVVAILLRRFGRGFVPAPTAGAGFGFPTT